MKERLNRTKQPVKREREVPTMSSKDMLDQDLSQTDQRPVHSSRWPKNVTALKLGPRS